MAASWHCGRQSQEQMRELKSLLGHMKVQSHISDIAGRMKKSHLVFKVNGHVELVW